MLDWLSSPCHGHGAFNSEESRWVHPPQEMEKPCAIHSLTNMVVLCVAVRESSGRDTRERDRGQMREGLYLERRYETRLASMKLCQFSLMLSVNSDSATIVEGTGVAVNQSTTGLLLLASFAAPQGRLLEVVIQETSLAHSMSLVKVQWSKLVRENSDGQLHLVGCRKTFPSFHYVAF